MIEMARSELCIVTALAHFAVAGVAHNVLRWLARLHNDDVQSNVEQSSAV